MMRLAKVVRCLSSIQDVKDTKDNRGYTARDLTWQEGHVEVVINFSGQEIDVNQESTPLISKLFVKLFYP